jgi:CheY-like chemotaxis protein
MPPAKMKILILSDSEADSLELTGGISGQHPAATTVASGPQALRLLAKFEFALVIVDRGYREAIAPERRP